MYKLLLCWRYLRTRYIALVCIVSVSLGVATMIVVNSVMAGFTTEMQARLNGMLGDVVFECRSLDGMADAEMQMAKIRQATGDAIVGMSPTVSVPALMYIEVMGPDRESQSMTKSIMLVGIDETTYADVSDFDNYLQHPSNRQQLEFKLRDGGYDVYDHQAEDKENLKPRKAMERAGWPYRRYKASLAKQRDLLAKQRELVVGTETPLASSPAEQAPSDSLVQDPFRARAGEQEQGQDFDPSQEQHTGIVLGIGTCSYRGLDGTDIFYALPGDDVRISFPTASMPVKAINEHYSIVDVYESKMSEYDSNFVFVPIRALQESRGLIDPVTGIGKFSSIQIKLRPGVDANEVRDQIRDAFPAQLYMVSTWRDKQGPLLAAVQMEQAVLNVLLFMIIAVAGFGILAIFTMIVVEKTRDIGILKSLGASSRGVLGIFLGYGLSLGIVGAGAGMGLGLLIIANINEIADLLGRLTGQPVFDPSIYYFSSIPTIVDPETVAWICLGAVSVAVMASVLPARRAASLHPVRALQYE